ncbi:MAG: hypothetical protein PHI11_14855 [Gallionella sp.]|nr:hypothetical protein [Gallionella sp.]
MNETRLGTIEQLEQFLSGCTEIEFTPSGDEQERYAHISRVLKRFDYPRQSRRAKGVLLKYLQVTSHYSRAQVAQWQTNRLAAIPLVKRYRAPATAFARKYTAADVTLLVEMDKANEDVCGPAIAHLLQRAYRIYDDARYERLADLSVSHLYNPRLRGGRFCATARVIAPCAWCSTRPIPCVIPLGCAKCRVQKDGQDLSA